MKERGEGGGVKEREGERKEGGVKEREQERGGGRGLKEGEENHFD